MQPEIELSKKIPENVKNGRTRVLANTAQQSAELLRKVAPDPEANQKIAHLVPSINIDTRLVG